MTKRQPNPVVDALRAQARRDEDALADVNQRMRMYWEIIEWAMDRWWELRGDRQELRQGVSDAMSAARDVARV